MSNNQKESEKQPTPQELEKTKYDDEKYDDKVGAHDYVNEDGSVTRNVAPNNE